MRCNVNPLVSKNEVSGTTNSHFSNEIQRNFLEWKTCWKWEKFDLSQNDFYPVQNCAKSPLFRHPHLIEKSSKLASMITLFQVWIFLIISIFLSLISRVSTFLKEKCVFCGEICSFVDFDQNIVNFQIIWKPWIFLIFPGFWYFHETLLNSHTFCCALDLSWHSLNFSFSLEILKISWNFQKLFFFHFIP